MIHKIRIQIILCFFMLVSSVYSAEIINWKHLNYSVDNIVPKIDFVGNINLDDFEKFDVSRSYRGEKKVPNLLIYKDNIYILDNRNTVLVFSLPEKKVIQKYELRDLTTDSSSGMAMDEDNLYITFEDGLVVAISLATEQIYWQTKIGTPINSAPVVLEGKLFFVSNNTVYALNSVTGNILWNAIGSKFGVSLRTLHTPTLFSDYLLVGLSSSDVLVLRQEQGGVFWKGSMAGYSRTVQLVNPLVGDIKAPILVMNNKMLVSTNNQIALYDIINKKEVWTNAQIGSYNSPLIYKKQMYVVDLSNNLVNMDMSDGSINWQVMLSSKKQTKKRIFWFGPYFINNSLFLTNSAGEVVLLSAKNGKVKSSSVLFTYKKERLFSPPVITSKYIAILSSYGNLYLYETK